MINIINANSDLGVHVDGSNLGPKKLTDNINITKYNIDKEQVIKSKDSNDLKKNLDAVNSFTEKIFKKELEILESNNFPLLIGGDHSTVIGSALASNLYNENIGIIWIDAHGDYNTFETTHSGNLHGLPLAAITGYKCSDLTSFIANKYINPKNAVVVGARSIDPWEIGNMIDAGVTIFTTEDIKKYGTKTIMDRAFDVIDCDIAPGVSKKKKNGINEIEANEIMDILIDRKQDIKSMDFVEFNPLNDINDKTYDIASNLLNKFIEKASN